jgi:uncharacterized Zn-binding protein involved in type VI secretion
MASLGAARLTDSCGGNIISTKSKDLNINGKPAATRTSAVSPHGDSPHSSTRIVTASKTVNSGGIGLARRSDRASCGHSISSSSDNVRVG